MSKQYFELHITMMEGIFDPNWIADQVRQHKWRHSVIDGDPNLGPGRKHYATLQLNQRVGEPSAIKTLLDAADKIQNSGIEVVRRKVERVLFDDRSSKVRATCNGACPECHQD